MRNNVRLTLTISDVGAAVLYARVYRVRAWSAVVVCLPWYIALCANGSSLPPRPYTAYSCCVARCLATARTVRCVVSSRNRSSLLVRRAIITRICYKHSYVLILLFAVTCCYWMDRTVAAPFPPVGARKTFNVLPLLGDALRIFSAHIASASSARPVTCLSAMPSRGYASAAL